MPTYSIQYRVQRVTTERAYVQVPVTGAVMSIDDGKLDVDKVRAAALALAAAPDVRWFAEAMAIDVHPIQGPKEPGES
jgi:hypothetical protein